MYRVCLTLFRRSAVLLLLFAACSCKAPSTSRPDVYHLASLTDYADTWGLVHRKGGSDVFTSTLAGPKGKRYRALVQKQPGGVAFYYWPSGQATLRFRTQFDQRQKSDLSVSVVVDGDYPAPHRTEFAAKAEGSFAFPLEETGGPVRVMLQARSRNLSRLGGVLYWIDPVIEEFSIPPDPGMLGELAGFRKRQEEKNVLLLVLDAAAYSHFGFAGYGSPTTPNIDRLAKESVVFSSAVAPAPYTMASTGSLLTGLHPYMHGVYEKSAALHESFRTLAEALREAGWRTALFSANPNVSAATGYDQGFHHVWDVGARRRINADEIASALMEWIGEQQETSRFFAYAHFREPHSPYTPPRELLVQFGGDPTVVLPAFDKMPEPAEDWKQKARAAYDANLAFADAQVGRVFDYLEQRNLLDDTIIVITSDHGEAFWQHGLQGHNSQVYEEMLRIPLLMRFPGERQMQGIRRARLTGTIDIFPTFADLFRLPAKGYLFNGKTLLPGLFNEATQTTSRLLVSHNSILTAHSLRSETLKYILDTGYRTSELFDLKTDPGEQQNVHDRYPISARFFDHHLEMQLQKLKSTGTRLRQGRERRAEIDAEMEEQLRALGYVQ